MVSVDIFAKNSPGEYDGLRSNDTYTYTLVYEKVRMRAALDVHLHIL